MINPRTALLLPVLLELCFAPVFLVFLPRLSSAQVAYSGAVPGNKIEEFNVKIARTAEALGSGVYEDYPVQLGSFYRAASSVPVARLPSAPLGYQVPEPRLVKAPVPQEFSDPEGTSYTGAAVAGWGAAVTQVADLGYLPGTSVPPSFEAISDRVMKASRSSAFPARGAGQPSLFTNEGFVNEFERVTGARFAAGNSARFLIDGEASFQVKDALIKNARKSLLIASWAFCDDTTGYEAAQMLIAKHKEGVKVQVMLDDIMYSSHGKKVVKMMRDAGIEVLLHSDTERYSDIWHVKVMIADDKYAVAGGMNFGDVYSHKAGALKWRDTDVLFSGPSVTQARKLLADEWNSQVSSRKLPFSPVNARGPQNPGFETGSARVAVILQDPPKSSPILVSIVKAMYGATKTINIENAYFVPIPVITRAILDARTRGVEINLLTNSRESIDAEGKPIADAIAEGLVPLVQAGVNVYLKQGNAQTLHSKFMTVDGEFAGIGSYNMHPRSERSDSELNVNILDRASVAQLDRAFSLDISLAKKVNSVKELEGAPGLVSQILSNYFYYQLSSPVQLPADLTN